MLTYAMNRKFSRIKQGGIVEPLFSLLVPVGDGTPHHSNDLALTSKKWSGIVRECSRRDSFREVPPAPP